MPAAASGRRRRQATLRRDNALLNLASAQRAEHPGRRRGVLRRRADRLAGVDRRETYAQADRSLKVTEEQRAAGRLSEFELLRARVARDSLQPSCRARTQQPGSRVPAAEATARPAARPAAGAHGRSGRPVLSPPPRFAAPLAEADTAGAAGIPPGRDAGRQRGQGRRSGASPSRGPNASRRSRSAPTTAWWITRNRCPTSTTGARTGRVGVGMTLPDPRRRSHSGQRARLHGPASTKPRRRCGWPKSLARPRSASTRSDLDGGARRMGEPAAARSSRRSAPTRSPSCAIARACRRSSSCPTPDCSWPSRR